MSQIYSKPNSINSLASLIVLATFDMYSSYDSWFFHLFSRFHLQTQPDFIFISKKEACFKVCHIFIWNGKNQVLQVHEFAENVICNIENHSYYLQDNRNFRAYDFQERARLLLIDDYLEPRRDIFISYKLCAYPLLPPSRIYYITAILGIHISSSFLRNFANNNASSCYFCSSVLLLSVSLRGKL